MNTFIRQSGDTDRKIQIYTERYKIKHYQTRSHRTGDWWWLVDGWPDHNDPTINTSLCLDRVYHLTTPSSSTESQNIYHQWTVFPLSKDSPVHSGLILWLIPALLADSSFPLMNYGAVYKLIDWLIDLNMWHWHVNHYYGTTSRLRSEVDWLIISTFSCKKTIQHGYVIYSPQKEVRLWENT